MRLARKKTTPLLSNESGAIPGKPEDLLVEARRENSKEKQLQIKKARMQSSCHENTLTVQALWVLYMFVMFYVFV